MGKMAQYFLGLSEQLGDSIEDLHAMRTHPMGTVKKELK